MKKVVSLLLSLAIVTTMLFSVTFSVSAYSVPDEKGFAEKLSSLRNQQKHGSATDMRLSVLNRFLVFNIIIVDFIIE